MAAVLFASLQLATSQASLPTSQGTLQVSFGESVTPGDVEHFACHLAGVSSYFTLHVAAINFERYPAACGR